MRVKASFGEIERVKPDSKCREQVLHDQASVYGIDTNKQGHWTN